MHLRYRAFDRCILPMFGPLIIRIEITLKLSVTHIAMEQAKLNILLGDKAMEMKQNDNKEYL